MKLKTISISCFRSIKSVNFTFPESGILVLVGSNNAGKSNVIRAINMICGDGWVSPENLEDHDFYQRDRNCPIKVKLAFDNGHSAQFSSEEKWASYHDERGRKLFNPPIKEAFPCTYLGADRTLDKHLAFTEWSLLGKIKKSFHKKAKAFESELQTKFEDLVSTFDRVDGFVKFRNDFSEYFSRMQADTSAKLSIDFKPFTPSNYFKTMQILATDPNQTEDLLDLSELGEGSRNTVLLALLRSYAENFRGSSDELCGLLALEEPELFLHPQARRHLYSVLRELPKSGIQVVISTHSDSFVDTEFFDSIGQVFKVPDEEDFMGRQHTVLKLVSKKTLVEHCVATGVPKGRTSVQNISEYYATTSNPKLNEAFFAKCLILVEGETEELALPEYLKAAGIDCDLLGISIVGVGGKNQIPKYWRLFSQFQTPVITIFDNDEDSSGNDFNSNENICGCFGINISDLKSVDVFRDLSNQNTRQAKVIVLQKDFETAISKDFGTQYPKSVGLLNAAVSEAKELIRPNKGQAKGLIARYVARKLESEIRYTPTFVSQLIQVISQSGIKVEEREIPF